MLIDVAKGMNTPAQPTMGQSSFLFEVQIDGRLHSCSLNNPGHQSPFVHPPSAVAHVASYFYSTRCIGVPVSRPYLRSCVSGSSCSSYYCQSNHEISKHQSPGNTPRKKVIGRSIFNNVKLCEWIYIVSRSLKLKRNTPVQKFEDVWLNWEIN